MSAKMCPRENCDGVVKLKEATEMPTLTNEDDSIKTVFDVRYCTEGHNLRYEDRQEPIGETAPIRNR